jgi:hypothetical protein
MVPSTTAFTCCTRVLAVVSHSHPLIAIQSLPIEHKDGMNLFTSMYLGQSQRGNVLTDVTLSFVGAPRLAAVCTFTV